jgi:hypothetical protein
MNDEAAALAALGVLASAQSAQMPLTALLALSRKLRLSPVLSAASGVEAVRLSAA